MDGVRWHTLVLVDDAGSHEGWGEKVQECRVKGGMVVVLPQWIKFMQAKWARSVTKRARVSLKLARSTNRAHATRVQYALNAYGIPF